VPTLRYHDAPGAIRFLTEALAWTAGEITYGPDDRVVHAELGWGKRTLMVSSRSDQPSPFDTGRAACTSWWRTRTRCTGGPWRPARRSSCRWSTRPTARASRRPRPEGNVWCCGHIPAGADRPVGQQPIQQSARSVKHRGPPNARERCRRCCSGSNPAQVLHTLVRLGIPELLADGPADVGQLAARSGSHPPSLRRLLRAAAGLG